MKDERVKPGSVVQTNSRCNEWSYCLILVTDVHEWGVTGGIRVPYKGIAYTRLEWDRIEYVGQAPYVLATNEE